MCRDESGIVLPEGPERQLFSIAVHPSRQLILFSDGFVVTAVEPLVSSATSSCLSLMWRLAAASERTLSHMLKLRPYGKLSFLSILSDSNRCVLDTGVGFDSETRSSYQFEATPANASRTVLDEEYAAMSYVNNVDRGQVLFGPAENLLSTGDHNSDVIAVTDADEIIGLVLKALMLSWGLAATHSGMWTEEHETVAEAAARNFIKLFAVILGDGGIVEEDGTRLQQVLELFRRIVRVASMDHIGWHLSSVIVAFIRGSAELFLKMRSTRTKGLHTLHGVALAINFAEQQYARTYSPSSAENSPHLRTYLDQISTATDMFSMPSVFASDRLDWVILRKNEPVLASLCSRLAANCYHLVLFDVNSIHSGNI